MKMALATYCRSTRECLRPEELLLPRPPQGVPDLPVRPAARRARRSRDRGQRGDEEDRDHPDPHGGGRGEADARRVHPRELLVDLNRTGVPLIEIVSEPDMRRRRGGGLPEAPARDPGLSRRSATGTWRRGVPLRRHEIEDAGKAEAMTHPQIVAKRFPVGAIVARPGLRVALQARAARSRHEKGTLQQRMLLLGHSGRSEHELGLHRPQASHRAATSGDVRASAVIPDLELVIVVPG